MGWLPHAVSFAVFLKSIGAGVLIGAVFACIMLLRGPNAGRAAAAAADILFFLSAAVLTFVFFLSFSFGQPRLFLLAGEGIGALLFYAVYASLRRSVRAAAGKKKENRKRFRQK